MKIARSLFIALVLSLSFAACQNKSSESSSSGTDTAGTTVGQTDTAAVLDSGNTDTLGTTGNDRAQ